MADSDINPRQVQDAWIKFREIIIPRDASTAQIQEMRRAFYSGALSFYNILMQDDIAGADVPESRGEDVMRSLDAELRAFFENVAAGRL